jgi:hypothetical protein
MTYVMRHVICPKCGDAVGGRLPSGGELRELICSHCHEKFEFNDADVSSGPVTHDEGTNRWKRANLA